MKLADPRAVGAFACLTLSWACSSRALPGGRDGGHDAGVSPDATGDVDSPVADADTVADGPLDQAADAQANDVAAADASDAPDATVADATDGAGKIHPGFTLVLDEEFNSPLDLDTDPVWTWGDGAPNPGYTRFQKDALSFAGGQLIITSTAKDVPAGTSYSQPAMNQETGAMPAKSIVSGELRTRHNNYRYGVYEARISVKARPAVGSPPSLAAFCVDRQPEWAAWREIDLDLWTNQPSDLTLAIYYTSNTSFPVPWIARVPGGAEFNVFETHDYSFTWLPDRVQWTVDGQIIEDSTSTDPDPRVPTLSGKIRLNLWTPQLGLPPPAASDYPRTMAVDYVRFYKWDGDVMYPCSPAPSCLPKADRVSARNNASEPDGGL